MIGDQWNSRQFPEGCRGCEQTQYKMVGQGLCNRCYRRWAKIGGDVQEWLDDPTREIPTLHLVEAIDEPFNRESDDEPTPTIRPGETRPGSGGSPLTDDGTSPPGVEKPRGESAPRHKKPGLFSRRRKPQVDVLPPKTKEKAPKSSGRRINAAEDLGDLYAGIGNLVKRSPGHASLGNYLTWQAPAAGELLDAAVKDTFVDRRAVQPAVRARASFDVLASLLGPPAIIFAIERNPARARVLIPMLETSIRGSLPTLLPAMKKTREREAKVDEAVREMFPDLEPGVDPVKEIIVEMFGYNFFAAGAYDDLVDPSADQTSTDADEPVSS